MAYIPGNSGNNVLVGTADDDDIRGFGGDDVLIGSGGYDYLDGGTGADTMDGGAGNDTYVVDNIEDEVVEYENKGNDTIRSSITYSLNYANHVENLTLTGSADIDGYGNTLDNSITGNSGDNDLWGLDGDDVLKGGGGADYLNGGTGDDLMLGGTGNDYYVVGSAGDTVTEYDGQGIDTVAAGVSYTLGDHVEKLIMTAIGNSSGIGNALNNEITGNSWANYINGGAGADIMKGGGGWDQYYVDQMGDQVIEYANEGNDLVISEITYTLGANLERLTLAGSANINGYGNNLDNQLTGNSGVNELYGYGGSDSLYCFFSSGDKLVGGTGDDYYHIDNSSHQLVELAGGGTDWVFTYGDMSYTLPDNFEVLQLDSQGHFNNGTGNASNNIIYGSMTANVIDGGLGTDTMSGWLSDDTYIVDTNNDDVIEGIGEGTLDRIQTSVTYVLDAGSEVEVLETTNPNGTTAMNLVGNEFGNTIIGNAGSNSIVGGLGIDTMVGGAGADVFIWNAINETGATVPTADVIGADFSQPLGDLLALNPIDADGNAGNGDTAFSFIGNANSNPFTAAGQISWFDNGSDTYIMLNTDADTDAEGIIRVLGVQTVDASWFVL